MRVRISQPIFYPFTQDNKFLKNKNKGVLLAVNGTSKEGNYYAHSPLRGFRGVPFSFFHHLFIPVFLHRPHAVCSTR